MSIAVKNNQIIDCENDEASQLLEDAWRMINSSENLLGKDSLSCTILSIHGIYKASQALIVLSGNDVKEINNFESLVEALIKHGRDGQSIVNDIKYFRQLNLYNLRKTTGKQADEIYRIAFEIILMVTDRIVSNQVERELVKECRKIKVE